METYEGSWMLPVGPRDGGQGRRQVSPVWWSSDESSYVPSGLKDRPADDFASRDEIEDKTTQQGQSVRTKGPHPSLHTARTQPDRMSFTNRLRRKTATSCLSAQYLESGGCSTHESREASTVELQTIRSPVATQDVRERTNHRARHGCQLSADMNQPKVVKISSGIRRVDARTLAAMLEAGVWDDRDDSAAQGNVHKSNGRTSSGTEDTHTRSSIASKGTTATVWTGNVTARLGPAQHFEAPNLSPQHAEFLNVHSGSIRHESLLLPARGDLSNPRHRIEEQNNVDRLKPLMAKFDSKARAHAKARQRPRGQAVMRAEIASPQAAIDDGYRLAKIPDSRHWSEPLGTKELPRFANNMVLRRQDTPGYLLQRGHSTGESGLLQQRPPLATGSQEVRPSRANFELGQARTVRFSKPGKASVIKICPHETRSLDLVSLGLVETDLMFSAGAMAKSARRANVRAGDTRPHGTRSSAIEGATESMPPIPNRRSSRIPRAVPGIAEHAARPSKRPIGSSTDMDRGVRFPRLLQRLTNGPTSNEGAGHGSVQELPRTVLSAAPASKPLNDRWTTGRIQSSFTKYNAGRLSLDENPRQHQIPNENDSTLTSSSRISADPSLLPGNSGCPSLISDDGQEPCDLPEAMANEHARLPISTNVSAWEKEDASTALNKTSSEGSSTLVHININVNEPFSEADTEAIHDENIRADEIHAGVGTSSCDERGWLSRAPRRTASPTSTHYHDLGNVIHAQLRGDRMMVGRRLDMPTRYTYCAILRWLISTSDAPGTPGMRNESSTGQELLDNAGEYQPRLDDNHRSEMQRTLNRLSDGIEPHFEPSDEATAFIRSMNRGSGP